MDVKIEEVPCDSIFNVTLTEKNKLLGRAILTKHVNYVEGTRAIILLDIYLYNSEDQGKGYGSKLMKLITDEFDCVATGISTKLGRQICTKFGFKMELIDGRKWLVYRRGKNAA